MRDTHLNRPKKKLFASFDLMNWMQRGKILRRRQTGFTDFGRRTRAREMLVNCVALTPLTISKRKDDNRTKKTARHNNQIGIIVCMHDHAQ